MIHKYLILLFFVLFSLVFAGYSFEIIEPDEIKTGDTGYGITVFKGTDPETFTFSVISVMKNFLPQQDIIIIKMEGDTLNFTGIIAGMSGSPVFINDKLAGAVAYGWPNSKEPLAGVAPIKNMLQSLSFPVTRPEKNAEINQSKLPQYSKEGLQPLVTPLYISGIQVNLLNKFKDKFKLANFYPIQAGNVISTLLTDKEINSEIYPGGAIGVSLMQGDVNITAIGTVTYVDTESNKVLAFGHPFFNDGFVDFPVTSAYIHTVISKHDRSFKLGSALDIKGRLYSDNVSCVAAVLDTYTQQIEMNVNIVDGFTGLNSNFNYRLVDDKNLTPFLVLTGYLSAINTYHRTERVNAVVETEIILQSGEIIQLDNHYAVDMIYEYYNMILPFFYIYGSRFEVPKIKSINSNIIINPEYKRYYIDNILLSKNEYISGETVNVTIRLKKDFTDEFIYKNLEFKIPETINEGIYQLLIEGGSSIIMRDYNRLENHNDLINFIKDIPNNDILRVSLILNNQKIFLKNKGLNNLPVNVANILASYNINFMQQFINFDYNTKMVLSGQRGIILRVSHERF